jgi:hypothetical protein
LICRDWDNRQRTSSGGLVIFTTVRNKNGSLCAGFRTAGANGNAQRQAAPRRKIFSD